MVPLARHRTVSGAQPDCTSTRAFPKPAYASAWVEILRRWVSQASCGMAPDPQWRPVAAADQLRIAKANLVALQEGARSRVEGDGAIAHSRHRLPVLHG